MILNNIGSIRKAPNFHWRIDSMTFIRASYKETCENEIDEVFTELLKNVDISSLVQGQLGDID